MASEANDGYAERIHFDNLCHLPGHTPIYVGEIAGRTLYRFRCSEAAGEPEQSFLHEVLPSFVTNVIIKVRLLPARVPLHRRRLALLVASDSTVDEDSVRSPSSTQCDEIQ